MINSEQHTPPDEAPMQPVWALIKRNNGHVLQPLYSAEYMAESCAAFRVSELIERSTHDRAMVAKNAEIVRLTAALDADGGKRARAALGQEGGE